MKEAFIFKMLYLQPSSTSYKDERLLFLLFTSLTLSCVLSLDTTGTAAAEWRLQREVNVLLRVQPHHEARNIDNLK
jgi:hypothetical protein